MKTNIRIQNALIKVMMDKNIDKIIVADICDEAQISRPTFYANFSDKFDVLNCIFDDLFDNTVLKYRNSQTWDGSISTFLVELQSNKKFYGNAYSYRGQNCLFDHHTNRVFSFYSDLIEDAKNDYLNESELYSLKIYVHGAMALIDEWIGSQFETSVEQLEHFFKVSMPENIKMYLLFNKPESLK